AHCGIASKTAPAWPSFRTASRKITRSTWRMAGRVSCWAMEDCATGARTSSKRITRHTSGAESISRRECSASMIPATTATADRWWCRRCGRMWNSKTGHYMYEVFHVEHFVRITMSVYKCTCTTTSLWMTNFISIRPELEGESCGKLQDAGQAVGADFLQGTEIAWSRIGHQVTGLVERCSVAAGTADGVVSQLVDPVAVLHVIIRVVEQIERLRLKFQFLAFADLKAARQPNVDPLQPRAVEGIQAD